MARISFKKAVAVAAVAHVVVLVVSVLSGGLEPSTSQSAATVLDDHEYIETQRIQSTMVSEQLISEQMKEFEELRSSNAQQEDELSQQIAEMRAEKSRLETQVKDAGSKLQNLNSDVKSRQDEIDRLAEQERAAREAAEKAKELEAKEAAKKLEAEQQAAEAEQKRLQEQAARLEQQAAQLEKTRKSNAALLEEVQKNNRAIEDRKLARARGVYEKGIHDSLIENWHLPYLREKSHCRVSLTLTPRGVIESYQVHQPCGDMYVRSIEDAIDRTAFLPSAPDKIFKKIEVVNFIDNVNGVIIR